MMSDSLPHKLSDSQARFQIALEALRDQAHRWTLRPRSPEAKVMDCMMTMMEMTNLHQAQLIGEREQSEIAQRQRLEEAEARMEQCVAKCEGLLDQCTRSAAEEILEVRRALHEGIVASRQLQKIDEKTVKAKVAEILATMRHEVAETMTAQIKMAGLFVKRDEFRKAATWNATLLAAGIILGVILNHVN